MSLETLAAQELERLCRDFPLKRKPVLVWKSYRVTAGMAYFRTYTIGLSARVLKSEESVIETLRHEYAHLMAFDQFGPKAAGHGVHWQNAMQQLGLKPIVKHRYEVERNKPRQKVIYSCKRCGLEIPRNRRLPRGRRYFHVHCGGSLVLKRIETLTSQE